MRTSREGLKEGQVTLAQRELDETEGQRVKEGGKKPRDLWC
jgi:hypothetical protein